MTPSSVNQLLFNIPPPHDIKQSSLLIQNFLTTKGLQSKQITLNDIGNLPTSSLLIVHCNSDAPYIVDASFDFLLSDITLVLVLHSNATNFSPFLKSLIKFAKILILSPNQDMKLWLNRSLSVCKTIQIPLPKPLPSIVLPKPQLGFKPPEIGYQLAFIGDLSPSNQPFVLLNTLQKLRALQQTHICLQWLATHIDEAHFIKVKKTITALGLDDAVTIIDTQDTNVSRGKVLEQADLYVCLSSERNTGLLCAAQLKIPIIAQHTPNEDQGYNQLGLRILKLDSNVLAATVQQVIINPRLRSTLITTALEVCRQYNPSFFYQKLQQELTNIDVFLPVTENPTEQLLSVRIEGPYDSSYSLAIVNRELARALHQNSPNKIGLYATEGGGDFQPNSEFLKTDPVIASIAQQSDRILNVDTCLRLLYPPRVSAMQGTYNGLNLYGWEESYIPTGYISDFNRHLHFSTTMSKYVSRTLRDNGANIPLFTLGIGADHILNVKEDSTALPELPNTLRLLHISSCFPRKGVDILLAAYGTAFTSTDDVCLIIKTFANPHHDIAQQIQLWQLTLDDPPQILLINEDLPPSAIRALYQTADVLVAPSRGEGFGLPMAEAMLHELPVITTGYGGQTDFCTEQTAWLIDYSFSRAASHISGNNSVWVDPCKKDLSRLLAEFYEAHQTNTLIAFSAAKTNAAKTLISEKYSWQSVAKRCNKSIAMLPNLPVLSPEPKFAIVTSWNSKCGIATYSKLLVQPALPNTLILANHEPCLIAPDEVNVIRCWQSGGDINQNSDDLNTLFNTIIDNDIEQVMIEFNFSFFELGALKILLQKLHKKGVQILMTLHSTADVYWGEKLKTLRDLQPQIHHIERVFVHSIADLNQLKAFNIVDNVSLFPHGVKRIAAVANEASEPSVLPPEKLRNKTVLASYGFLLPHKGIDVLIETFNHIHQGQPDSHLLLITAEYPAPISAEHLIYCRTLITHYQLTEHITLVSDFLTDQQSLTWLSLADCIIYPYQQTQESSSAAVRWGIALGKPVFCTPLNIFDDVASAVHYLPGTQALQMAEGIRIGLQNTPQLAEKSVAQAKWLIENDWNKLSKRLKNILSGLALDKHIKSKF
jgi:glycosyltransferase involved in cell wall biosynthesis